MDWQRKQVRIQRQKQDPFWRKLIGLLVFSRKRKLFRFLLFALVVVAILPPLYFHFNLRRHQQLQLRKCKWTRNPPLVCAHGGDSSKAFPNTMDAYRIALDSQVDCIEIDVSRSADGVLFALHDRDLLRISGNHTSKVGHLSMKEIKDLGSSHQNSVKFHDVNIPTIEDALKACKHLRKRCPTDCIFAPYFPPNNRKRFEAVHKIYGASNIGKMLQDLPVHFRAEAADSLCYEANCRERDPVYGSVGVISVLQQQIYNSQCQLAQIQAEIAVANAQYAQTNHQQNYIQNQVDANLYTDQTGGSYDPTSWLY